MPREITQFMGANRFLSNFYYHPISFDGYLWPTSEHAYQAAKTNNSVSKELIRNAETPARARIIGREVSLIPDWHVMRRAIMRDILAKKFRRVGGLMAFKLISTGDALLIAQLQGDHYWGAVSVGGKWVGENWLGKLLMDRRAELQCKERTLFDGDER